MATAYSSPALRGISHFNETWLKAALKAAPSYNIKLAEAIKRTIRCIHGLENLHNTIRRSELDVYLGRATEGTLAERWKQHAKKGFEYGMILFTCDPDRVEGLEHTAIKILQKLTEHKRLCVGSANVYPGSSGSKPRQELALVYMTWKPKPKPVKFEKPSISEIREIAKEVTNENHPFKLNAQQVENGLNALKRINEIDRLHWWQP